MDGDRRRVSNIPAVREPAVPAVRVLRIVLVSVSALLVVLAFVSRLSLFGVRPDAMLLVTVLIALADGSEAGTLAGYVCGLSIDLFLDTPLGLSALTFCLVGYAVGQARDRILPAFDHLPVAMVALASAGGELLLLVLAGTLGDVSMLGPGHVAKVVAVVVGWNLLLLRPARWLVHRGLGVVSRG